MLHQITAIYAPIGMGQQYGNMALLSSTSVPKTGLLVFMKSVKMPPPVLCSTYQMQKTCSFIFAFLQDPHGCRCLCCQWFINLNQLQEYYCLSVVST